MDETKKEYIRNYIKSMMALESEMEPYKEQKKELRTEFIDKGWLTKDEIWSAIRAYRMHCDGKDMGQINELYDFIDAERSSGKMP